MAIDGESLIGQWNGKHVPLGSIGRQVWFSISQQRSNAMRESVFSFWLDCEIVKWCHAIEQLKIRIIKLKQIYNFLIISSGYWWRIETFKIFECVVSFDHLTICDKLWIVGCSTSHQINTKLLRFPQPCRALVAIPSSSLVSTSAIPFLACLSTNLLVDDIQ